MSSIPAKRLSARSDTSSMLGKLYEIFRNSFASVPGLSFLAVGLAVPSAALGAGSVINRQDRTVTPIQTIIVYVNTISTGWINLHLLHYILIHT